MNEYITAGLFLLDAPEAFPYQNRSAPDKWSAQQILGHLIDSALYNLQRFTNARLQPPPYRVKRYDQDGLVRVNAYHAAYPKRLAELWYALNKRIEAVVDDLSPAELARPVILPDGEEATLRFLIDDYVAHGLHHLKQIKELIGEV